MSVSHFLYADDLVLVSKSEDGLQKSLDNLHIFANSKHLAVSVKKSKTVIFNKGGKLIDRRFSINGQYLENVIDFCYLGFNVKASGIVSHAMNILYDKANKAMRPLVSCIFRFKIPIDVAFRLFHSYIAPIALYNAENWMIFSDKTIKNYSPKVAIDVNSNFKIDVLLRKFIKQTLGLNKSCPNIAVYGETGQTPLSIKAFRSLLSFWYRITNESDTLAKKALLENISMRTNWIKTVEKLLGTFNLTDKIDNAKSLKLSWRLTMDTYFTENWKSNLRLDESSRLKFYKKIKQDFKFEEFLLLKNFNHRRNIAKIRCSDHKLEIETGRHRNILPDNRICMLCPSTLVESEEHFLVNCQLFCKLRV